MTNIHLPGVPHDRLEVLRDLEHGIAPSPHHKRRKEEGGLSSIYLGRGWRVLFLEEDGEVAPHLSLLHRGTPRWERSLGSWYPVRPEVPPCGQRR